MKTLVVTLGPLLASAGLVACASPPEPAPVSTTPDASGVQVRCSIGARGRPEGCVVLQESPLCRGRGRDVVRLVQSGRLSRETVEQAATDASFVVTVPCPPQRP
jgi:hypothetical protein